MAARASILGREAGVAGATLWQLEVGAGLHDVGKLALPESILIKGDTLGAAERAALEAHPRLGERILEPLAGLEEARIVVRWHHERVGGGGYPDGLKGEEIPFLARVVSICDAHDAMTKHRPYQAAEPSEHALRMLAEDRGHTWHRELVALFLRLVAEGKFRNLRPPEWMVRFSHG